jgi:hypothetical protein
MQKIIWGKTKFIFISFLFCQLTWAEIYSQWIQTEGPLDSLNIFFLMSAPGPLFVGTNSGLHNADSIPGIFDQFHPSKLSCGTYNGNKAFFGGYETGIIYCDLSKSPLIPDTFSHYTSEKAILCNDSCLYTSDKYGFHKCSYWKGTKDFGSFNKGLPLDSIVYSSTFTQLIYHINSLEQIHDTIFCATQKGIYRTRADTIDWKPVNSGLSPVSFHMLKIIHDTIFAADTNTLFFSINSGNTWDSCFSSRSPVTSVARFKGDTYISTLGEGIFTSRDGSVWTTLNSGLNSLKITAILPYKNILICGTLSDGFYFLDNNNWRRNNRGMIYTGIAGISSSNEYIYATTGSKVYISGNGSSWKDITPKLDYFGKKWYSQISTMKNMVFVSSNGEFPWGHNYIHYSTSKGVAWDTVSNIPNRKYGFNIAGFNDRLYVSWLNGWFYTTDLGLTWNASNVSNYPEECFLESENQNCNKDFQEYIMSMDQSWTDSATGLPREWLFSFNYLINSGDALFANLYLYVFVKSDTCPSWTKVGDSPGFNRGIRGYAHKDKNLFITTEYGLYYSDDYAQTWHALNDGLPKNNLSWLVIKNDTLLTGTYGYGIWIYDLNKIHFDNSAKCPCVHAPKEFRKLNFHPNPANDLLYIEKDNAHRNNHIRIVDIQGRQWLREPLNTNNYINISGFPSGIYFITLWNDLEYFFDKLVIVH